MITQLVTYGPTHPVACGLRAHPPNIKKNEPWSCIKLLHKLFINIYFYSSREML